MVCAITRDLNYQHQRFADDRVGSHWTQASFDFIGRMKGNMKEENTGCFDR